MKVVVNGNERDLKEGSLLKDALKGEQYVPGTVVAIHKSTESLRVESDDFEVMTTKGSFCIHLNGSEYARVWKASMDSIKGCTARWSTHNITAFGSFPTDLKVDRGEYMYQRYDCFFSLGGFDSSTTYMMVAKDNHKWGYGAGSAVVGRVTRGRHVIDSLAETDEILSIDPVVSETFTENYELTTDLEFRLEEGNRVESYIKIKLDMDAPESAEHMMVLTQKGYITATHVSGSYIASDDDMDIKIASETRGVREEGSIYVRSVGVGTGRMFFYKERRQMCDSFNHVGDVEVGRSIIASVREDDKITVVTDPPRRLAVGMTMAEGEKMLAEAGIKVERTGDTDDAAIVAEQIPEMTVTAIKDGKVQLFGVKREDIYRVQLDDSFEQDVHYFRKVTGLSHKTVGTLKVHFWFPGMTMVTFEGDYDKGKSLYPGDPFKRCKRGDLGLTNQACDHHGLIGIRVEASKEFGPTGEEPYGTNIFGKFAGDLDKFTDSLEDGKTVYITERKI